MSDAQEQPSSAGRAARPKRESLAWRLTHELSRVRQRGLADLDLDTHRKDEVEAPILQQLAHRYCQAQGVQVFGWVAEVDRFLRDGLEVYALQGNTTDEQFIWDLFFDSAKAKPPPGPHTLMEKVRKREGLAGRENDAKFAERRRQKFYGFAKFQVGLVNTVTRLAAAHEQPAAESTSASLAAGTALDPEPKTPEPAPVASETPLPPAPEPPLTPAPVDEVAVPPPPTPPRLRLWPLVMRVVLAAVVVLMVGIAVVRVPMASATTITGYIECWPDTSKPVVGAWIKATNGGSGWAVRHALPQRPNVNWFSYTLPQGGSYIVDAGCGGTPRHWEFALHSATAVLGGGYYFTCYDSTAPPPSPTQGLCWL